MRTWNRERRYPYKEAEELNRCLSCGKLYPMIKETGATCPSCEEEQAAKIPMARDTVPEIEHQDQDK